MLLIVGRTCTGKDTLTRELEKNGMSSVKSYTTRPKRFETENTHIFITKEQSEKINDKVATTNINGYEYFATNTQVKTNDIYIIDPNGLYELIKNCSDSDFSVVYVSADVNASKEKAIKRSKNKNENTIFDKRYNSENEQFTKFENRIKESKIISTNCRVIYEYKNDFRKETLHHAVKYIAKTYRKETTMTMLIKKLTPTAIIPKMATDGSAGYDLYVDSFETTDGKIVTEGKITLQKGTAVTVHTGIAMSIPRGYVGLLFARSSLACKHGIRPANCVGVIDSDYRGEVKAVLYGDLDWPIDENKNSVDINVGDKVAQIVFVEHKKFIIEVTDHLDNTDRGDGGFGSTGTK